MKKWSKKNINTIMEYYTDVLRLHEWNITYNINKDVEGSNCGSNTYNSQARLSHITLYKNLIEQDLSDLEQTIVHELLHLSMWPMWHPSTDLELIMYERALDIIAESMVLLRRDRSKDLFVI